MKPWLFVAIIVASSLPFMFIACPGDKNKSRTIVVSDRSSASGFVYQSFQVMDLSGNITLDGQPVQGAQIALQTVLEPPPPGGRLDESGSAFYSGFSDQQGVWSASLRLPSDLSEVDVVIHLVGTKGEYTHEELRNLWGYFAPSARITMPLSELSNATIALESL